MSKRSWPSNLLAALRHMGVALAETAEVDVEAERAAHPEQPTEDIVLSLKLATPEQVRLAAEQAVRSTAAAQAQLKERLEVSGAAHVGLRAAAAELGMLSAERTAGHKTKA